MADTKGSHSSARGFASMDQERQREIARKGGRSVPAERRSFSKNAELASSAGRKGGQSVPAAERTFSKNPALAARAGRKGGQASGIARGRGMREPEAAPPASSGSAPPAPQMHEAGGKPDEHPRPETKESLQREERRNGDANPLETWEVYKRR